MALYGGQIVGQALAAAARTVPAGRGPHLLNSFYLRPGRAEEPMLFTVQRVRDGRSFTLRTVDAHQDERHLCTVTVSYHVDGAGPGLQDTVAPETPAPEELPVFPVEHLFGLEARLPPQPVSGPWPTRYWVRAHETVPDLPGAHACVLAYLSDTGTPLFPAGRAHHGPTVSHSIWFHRRVDANEWLLVDLERRTMAHDIGYYTGALFDQVGRLVASIAQEALFQARPES
jgi:acyl-CoA thioesterase-2